jgi:hypothetical protein
MSTVLGHPVSRRRRRYLRQAEWIVAVDDTGPVGVAAYHCVKSDVRLVLEFLLDPALTAPDACRVTNLLISTLEVLARESGALCLMVVVDGHATMEPFERRGYRTVTVDATCAWLQKGLGPVEHPRLRTRRVH